MRKNIIYCFLVFFISGTLTAQTNENNILDLNNFPVILDNNKLIVNCRLARTDFSKVTWNDNIGAIVIPGGSVSQDFYITEEAVPEFLKSSGRYIGILTQEKIDNYKNFIAGKDVATIWSLNINDTLENQIAGVRRMLDNGIDISYLRLGNETYLRKFRFGEIDKIGVAKVITLEDYIQIMREWAPAFFNEFEIPLLWIGAPYDARTHEHMSYQINWAHTMTQFLDEEPDVSQYFAGVILHHYLRTGTDDHTDNYGFLESYTDWSVFVTESGTDNADWSAEGIKEYQRYHKELKQALKEHPKLSFPGLHVLYSPRDEYNHPHNLNDLNGQTPLGEVLHDYPWDFYTYDVGFTVYGQIEDSVFLLENASVTVNDLNASTDYSGKAIITIPSGPVSYQIRKNGFVSKELEFELHENVHIIDTLHAGNFNISFLFLDKITGDPVIELPFLFGGQESVTNVHGKTVFEDFPAGVNDLEIKTLRFSYNGVLDIYSDTSLVIYLDPIQYYLRLTVKDSFNDMPLMGAVISINDFAIETGIQGMASAELPFGEYDVEFSKEGYITRELNLSLSSDTNMVVMMDPSSAELRFRIFHGQTPLNNAEVTINEETRLSNALGICAFPKLCIGTEYHYSLRRDGYRDIDSTTVLLTNTTIDIQMDLVTGINRPGTELFRIYPNPAQDILNIESNLPIRRIRIINALGIVVFTEEYNDETFLCIDISEIANGIYFISVESANDITNKQIIKR
jgi:hypothetical protein